MADPSKPPRKPTLAPPTATQPPKSEKHDEEPEKDEDNEPTVPVAPSPSVPYSAGPGAMADDLPQGGLIADLCEQSLRWHCMALRRILNVDPGELADILRHVADYCENPSG